MPSLPFELGGVGMDIARCIRGTEVDGVFVVVVPPELLPIGLALIFAVDRPLDMCRTVVNVTGDATVSMLVAKSVGKLGEPNVKNWDDNYEEVK